MRVAVITPYHKEDDETLRKCIESVAGQSYACTHILVADGFPRPAVVPGSVQHAVLPQEHGIGGDLPRGVGSIMAMKQGFDAMAYLDADNWFYPDHIKSLLALQRETAADVCIALRSMHRVDGSHMPRAQPPNQNAYFDTNCMFLMRSAFQVALVWATIPPQAAVIGDRIVSLAIRKHGFRIAKADHPTLAYRTGWAEDYIRAGEHPPPGAKPSVTPIGAAAAYWNDLPQMKKDSILGFPHR